MLHAAVFPSLTDSTVVWATPAKSPPQNSHGTSVCIVAGSTRGRPLLFNSRGYSALTTAMVYTRHVLYVTPNDLHLLRYVDIASRQNLLMTKNICRMPDSTLVVGPRIGTTRSPLLLLRLLKNRLQQNVWSKKNPAWPSSQHWFGLPME